jgi:hypothetical protein
VIVPHYSVAGRGRRPMPLGTMRRVYFVQQWFDLSDPQAEEMLYDSESMRRRSSRAAPSCAMRTRALTPISPGTAPSAITPRRAVPRLLSDSLRNGEQRLRPLHLAERVSRPGKRTHAKEPRWPRELAPREPRLTAHHYVEMHHVHVFFVRTARANPHTVMLRCA